MQILSDLLRAFSKELAKYKQTVLSILAAVDLTLDEFENLPLDFFREDVAIACKNLLKEVGSNEEYWLIVLNALDKHHRDLSVIVSGRPGPNLDGITQFAMAAATHTPNRHYELASDRVCEILSRC